MNLVYFYQKARCYLDFSDTRSVSLNRQKFLYVQNEPIMNIKSFCEFALFVVEISHYLGGHVFVCQGRFRTGILPRIPIIYLWFVMSNCYRQKTWITLRKRKSSSLVKKPLREQTGKCRGWLEEIPLQR